MRTIATWYYEQGPDEGGIYAEVAGDSSSEDFRDVYRRCLPVFFATARVANPDAWLLLFVNVPLGDNSVTSSRVSDLLGEIGVEQVVVDYASHPPSGWAEAWRNQFYVLDILRAATDTMTRADSFVLLDSDVVWTSPGAAGRFWGTLEASGCLTYDLGFPLSERENGVTAVELGRLRSVLTGGSDRPLSYLGGEIQAATGESLWRLSTKADDLWRSYLRDWTPATRGIGEEAHLLTLAYAELDIPEGGANPFIKRCWTQRLSHSNLTGDERGLALWHVPAEKRFGIPRLYREIDTNGFGNWVAQHGATLESHLSNSLGVPRTPARKAAADIAVRVRDRLSLGARSAKA